jgi:hypothetical protein
MNEREWDRTPARAAAPPWWAWPILLPGPLLAWHEVVARELAQVPDAPPWFASPALAWAGVGALLAGLLVETAFYGMLWAARRLRLPFASSFLVLLQLSMLEAFATAILTWAPGDGAGHAAALWLAGARAAWAGGAPGGFGSAFGSFGVLTLVRMALWAWAQAEGTGRRWREAAPMVAAVWLASHAALGWTMELIRGRSAMP